MDKLWRVLTCGECAGQGLVYRWDVEQCRGCKGGGRLFIRPSGHLFLYPGGQAMGALSPEDYERAAPLEEEVA